MSSGLLALLDDVALIAKTAAASVDDVAGMTAKAGSKAAGVVIDDAAVAPRFVMGFSPAREIPIVWKIAKGSVFNKLVILLPGALLLSQFAPWAITPILMAGGLFLCFEGAEKVLEMIRPHKEDASAPGVAPGADLEKVRVNSAIKTDLILSAEIMAISLSSLPDSPLWEQAIVLAAVGIAITAGVYGAVALIVKADDIGLHLAENSGSQAVQRFGRWLVRAMPWVLFALAKIGMVAMLWVGGGILLHGSEELGLHAPAEMVHHLQEAAGHAVPFIGWLAAAAASSVLGLAIGFCLVPLGHLVARLRGGH
ncbi:DUF808 domain-containing protein [Poseidonocella sp. HB161398]|uniref:DUF808 domain-containing protein n=1 Tax=Poseidonocella sp. HB161398 TaxID=2320855 RepID=UPI001109B698|nr:DUF808 domain-containing protein [Poseidonocella sp. HB161398]